MRIYIASSWKNQHAVEMLTALLRERGHEILSFVENNHGENPNASANEQAYNKPVPFDEWCAGEDGERSFNYDTCGATESDLVIYIGPSGTDAWAEVGAAWARGVPIVGLWAKGEQAGLMRRMVEWYNDYRSLLNCGWLRTAELGEDLAAFNDRYSNRNA
jgi:hypothetical protein